MSTPNQRPSDPYPKPHKWTCSHPDLTTDDGQGEAICVRCGGSVTIYLTLSRLREHLTNVHT